MTPDELQRVEEKLAAAVAERGPTARVAIVGWSGDDFGIAALPVFNSGAAALAGIFASHPDGAVRRLDALAGLELDIVVVSEDVRKEDLLEAIAPLLAPHTRLIIGGYGHFEFRDRRFEHAQRDATVASLANGYPNCLVHIYQCLLNAHRRGLQGVVAEFGMFRGGTTMLISRFIEAIGADWKVIGFDTFDGFPPPRSPLDMYAHPDCLIHDSAAVRSRFAARNVEIVEGDVVETVSRLADADLVLSFVDTDNFTSARAILEVVSERTQVGGSIVFDHWTGNGRFLDTIGERIAAKPLAADPRYFNLHGTGVFQRQM